MNNPLEQMIASRMGVEPPQAQPTQTQAPQDKAAPPQETAQEAASKKGAPKTEGTKMDADPVIYEIDMGEGQKRKFTPEQIKAMSERYSALNYTHQTKIAPLAPVLGMIERIMRDNPNMKPQELAAHMEAIYKAQTSNPVMGVQGQQAAQKTADGEDPLSRWERDNAAQLPPGYREMMQGNQQSMAALQQMQAMMRQMMAGTQGVADAAKTGMDQARSQRSNAIRQTIANNVDRAQQALGIPDSAANDFMTFSMERGYTLEDFVDPQLALTVMNDFKNNVNSPEMERLRGIAKRRQAYTGSLGTATPGSTAAAAEPPAANPLDKMIDATLAKRHMQ